MHTELLGGPTITLASLTGECDRLTVAYEQEQVCLCVYVCVCICVCILQLKHMHSTDLHLPRCSVSFLEADSEFTHFLVQ